jgi:hypothetical protein
MAERDFDDFDDVQCEDVYNNDYYDYYDGDDFREFDDTDEKRQFVASRIRFYTTLQELSDEDIPF